MRNLMFAITMLFASTAFAGFQGFQELSTGAYQDLKLFDKIQCARGVSCSRLDGKLVVAPPTLTRKNFFQWQPSTLTSGTSTTPVATTLYLSQIHIPGYSTLTGIKLSNGATVGTNKYIVALYDSAGTKLANSALAGVTTAGADVYQAIPFTSSYAAKGPGTFWIALWVNGTTDRFRTIPAVGEISGYAGTVTGQTFGTVPSTITPPTSFTADVGPVSFTY